jgi:hypothetical protein
LGEAHTTFSRSTQLRLPLSHLSLSGHNSHAITRQLHHDLEGQKQPCSYTVHGPPNMSIAKRYMSFAIYLNRYEPQALKKLRIVILGFGTARQKMVLE